MKLLAAATAVTALLLMLPAAARASVTIVPSCTVSGATAPCGSGWYTTDVTVSFSLSGSGFSNPTGCGNQTVTADTSGTVFRCTVDLTGGSVVGAAVTIKRDATPPTSSGIAAQRGPDMNGWYNHPIQVAVSGTDATSGIASCANPTYSGPDSGSASVSGTCTDNAGNVSSPQRSHSSTTPLRPARRRRRPGRGFRRLGTTIQSTSPSTEPDAVSGIEACTTATSRSRTVLRPPCPEPVATKRATPALQASPCTTTRRRQVSPAPHPTVFPMRNGWYNHSLLVSFAGADATSGIASCDAPTYGKPNDTAATLSGRCQTTPAT